MTEPLQGWGGFTFPIAALTAVAMSERCKAEPNGSVRPSLPILTRGTEMTTMQECETKTEIEVEIGNSVAQAVVTVWFLDGGKTESWLEVREFEGVKRPRFGPSGLGSEQKIWYALDGLISGEVDIDQIEKERRLEI